MKLINKLTLGYLTVGLFVAVVAYFGMISINHIGLEYNKVTEQSLPVLDAIEEVEAEGLNIIASTNKFVLIATAESWEIDLRDDEIKHLKAHTAKFDEAISEYEELVNKYFPEERLYLENLKNSGAKIKTIGDELIALDKQGASHEKILGKWKEFQLAEEEFRKAIIEAFANETREVEERTGNVQDAISAALKNILYTSLLTLAMAMVLGILISLNISEPINKLKNAAQEFGKGKFDTRVDIISGDEVGILASTFNEMAGEIKQDITDLKEAKDIIERQGRFSRTVINSMNDALSVIDVNDFRIVGVNPVFLKIYGLKEEDVIGKPCYQITHQRSQPCQPPDDICPLVETLKTGKLSTAEHIHYSNGKKTYVEISASPITDETGKIIQVIHIARDITERKRAEEMQRENERLILANQAKSDFLAVMSHELRTPLNAVIGFSELLMQSRAGALNEKQETYMGNVLSSGKHLLNLVNGILDLTKIESGKMEMLYEKFSVPQTVDETLELIQTGAEKRNVILKKEIEPQLEFIEADKRKFKQVLFNLLSNAIKFSKPEGGLVTVRAKMTGDMAEFSVSDTGIGIKEEDMGKLFRAFQQIDYGIARKYGGTGLGLAITKQLVELHGGTIRVESKYSEGSTFTFVLPVKQKKKE